MPTLTVLPATFTPGPLAPGEIASVFGTNLALSTAAAASVALPITLAGTSVTVQDAAGNNREAPLYYVSPGQVNFRVPQDLSYGQGVITVRPAEGQPVSVQTSIVPVEFSFFTINGTSVPAGYVVRVDAQGQQSTEAITTPIDVSTGNVYLILFGTGFDTATQNISVLDANNTSIASTTYAGSRANSPVWIRSTFCCRNHCRPGHPHDVSRRCERHRHNKVRLPQQVF